MNAIEMTPQQHKVEYFAQFSLAGRLLSEGRFDCHIYYKIRLTSIVRDASLVSAGDRFR
jgi:hypothetical protein